MRCDFCCKQTQIKTVQKYLYTDAELENVFLDNIEVRFCGECNLESPIIPKILKLHDTIGKAIVCKKSLLSNNEIRFLRKNLRIKSQDWAKLLRTDKSVYSRWENGSQKISPQSDLLIRYLYLRLLEEKKEVRVKKKIVENLSELTNEQTAIIIDVGKIENYSYLPIEEVLQMSNTQEIEKIIFDLNESNLFLSEIEKPLPFENLIGSPFRNSTAAANQELALAA